MNTTLFEHPTTAAPAFSRMLPQAQITLYPSFLSTEDADSLLKQLQKRIQWRHEAIWLYGKQVMQPRLTAWFGQKPMHYSGIAMPPDQWLPELLELKQKINQLTHIQFNSVLANLYRDGNDSVSWHTDAEPILGQNPVIASLSVGAERQFKYKHRTLGIQESLQLTHGSLLIMSGEMQHHWLHAVPKVAHVGQRINLTFRRQVID